MDSIQLRRLNMDNSWWIKLGEFSLIVDPWLKGKEVDYFSWFNTQYLRTAPMPMDQIPKFDAVLITQKYPDHFHKESLLALNPKKLIVPRSIFKAVKRLLPNAEVIIFNDGIQNYLNQSINVHYFPTARKIDPIYDSLIVENGIHSIFISTHGHVLNRSQVKMLRSLPQVELLLTPFTYYKLPSILGGVVSPGLEGVHHLMNQVKPTYVAATHDEKKIASGLVSKFARINYPELDEIKKQDDLQNTFLHIQDYQLVGL